MPGASHARGARSLINLGALLGNLNDYEGERLPSSYCSPYHSLYCTLSPRPPPHTSPYVPSSFIFKFRIQIFVLTNPRGRRDANVPARSRRRPDAVARKVPPPPLPPRTKWTRRVPHPVLTGHVSQSDSAGPARRRRAAARRVSGARVRRHNLGTALHSLKRFPVAKVKPPPPPYKVDTPRPSPRTNRTRRVGR